MDYLLLYLAFFFSLQKFCDNFKCQNHAWNHKSFLTLKSYLTHCINIRRSDYFYLEITPSTSFAQLIHFLLHPLYVVHVQSFALAQRCMRNRSVQKMKNATTKVLLYVALINALYQLNKELPHMHSCMKSVCLNLIYLILCFTV